MAKICNPSFADGPVNSGEERLLRYLEVNLPNDYYIVPNGNYPSKNPQGAVEYWEYDAIVVAPHAICHIENKDYKGRIEGYDDVWYHNDKQIRNPLFTARFKSKILASYLKQKASIYGKAWIDTIVVLSALGQTKANFDPESGCYQKTFLLDNDLLDYLQDNDILHKSPTAISDIQMGIVDHLTGSSQPKTYKKTRVAGYIIDETLDTKEDYIEYLCHKQFPADKKWKVRDYALDKAGMSPMQLDKHNKLVQNGRISEDSLPDGTAVIIKSQFIEEENHFYAITPYMDDHSLRSEMKRVTFTDMDKVKILLDLAQALSYAHEKSIIHRVVSPDNIFITADHHAALGNFGLSYNPVHEDADYNATIDIENFERDAYTPYEVVIGDSSEASDVYSFGVIAYELTTGQLPFNNYLQLRNMGGKLTEDKLPSHVNKNVETWVDELCQRTLTVEDTERWANIDEIRDFIFDRAIKSKIEDVTPAAAFSGTLSELKPMDMITNDVTLVEVLGEGGFSKVFKAQNSMMPGRILAAKIFKEEISPQATIDEFNALKKLDHPNIVKFVWNGTTNGGLFFTLMDFVNGGDIRRYTYSDMFLPLPIIYKFMQQMLSALVYMEEKEPPIIHRDIKPENIIYNKDGNFILIDFNIATDNMKNRHKVGTEPYMAPDLDISGKMQWAEHADTFALGVTLYELLTHVYPWPGSMRAPILDKAPTDIHSLNSLISDQFADFVMKACETRAENRFQTAKEMQQALEAIGEEGIMKKQTVTIIRSDTGEEFHIVDYINSLYSQSIRGNAGTRAGWKGDNILDDLTYTDTKLDTKLLEDIKQGKYRLVIITGNAGDGKTAFIRKVEHAAKQFEPISDTHNGARFELAGTIYQSNYDGSQDEKNLKNNDVLKSFFAPFANMKNFNQAVEGRIIAINEGRLIEFLEASPEHKYLYDAIDEYFYKEGAAPLPEGVMVINLNLRSVTAVDEEGQSLLKKQIKALTSVSLWSKCQTCPLADKCHIKYNVDSLSDQAVGGEIINRLEWIVRTIVYKREVHITMRDLRSMIAWLITRDYSCSDIPNLIAKTDELKKAYEGQLALPEHMQNEDDLTKARFAYHLWQQESWLRYYFNITAADSDLFPDLRSEDRIVKLLRETDIANVAIPDRDRDLHYCEQKETDYLAFETRKRSLLDEFNDSIDIRPSYKMTKEEIDILKMRHRSMIRYQYFEGKDDYMARMPYRSIGDFYKELKDEKGRDKVMKELAYAISCSEGCWNRELSAQHLLLSSSRIADPSGKSYRRFPLTDFELTVDTNDKLTEYLEHEHDSFIFRSKTKKYIMLNVSLDLYEMLDYIKNGFSPSVSDLKGRFIELQVFKNLLESETYTEVIVTNNEKSYYRISLDKMTMKLIVEPLNTKEG